MRRTPGLRLLSLVLTSLACLACGSGGSPHDASVDADADAARDAALPPPPEFTATADPGPSHLLSELLELGPMLADDTVQWRLVRTAPRSCAARPEAASPSGFPGQRVRQALVTLPCASQLGQAPTGSGAALARQLSDASTSVRQPAAMASITSASHSACVLPVAARHVPGGVSARTHSSCALGGLPLASDEVAASAVVPPPQPSTSASPDASAMRVKLVEDRPRPA